MGLPLFMRVRPLLIPFFGSSPGMPCSGSLRTRAYRSAAFPTLRPGGSAPLSGLDQEGSTGAGMATPISPLNRSSVGLQAPRYGGGDPLFDRRAPFDRLPHAACRGFCPRTPTRDRPGKAPTRSRSVWSFSLPIAISGGGFGGQQAPPAPARRSIRRHVRPEVLPASKISVFRVRFSGLPEGSQVKVSWLPTQRSEEPKVLKHSL